jgi:hypothetical protein
VDNFLRYYVYHGPFNENKTSSDVTPQDVILTAASNLNNLRYRQGNLRKKYTSTFLESKVVRRQIIAKFL